MNKAARILFKKGKKFEAGGNNAEAIAAYEEALNHSPQNADILFAIGNVAKHMGMLPIAEHMFRTVYGLLPDSIEAATNLALVINDQERTEEAIELFKYLLTLHPEHVGTWVNIGNAVASTDDHETAEIFYREALRLKPGSMEALTNLSEIIAARGDYDEALKLIDKALRRDKKNALIRYNRGELLLSAGRLQEGWPELEYGALNRKDRKTIYHHKLKRWKGDDLAGKKILLSCEQGIGDQVRYLNCLEDIMKRAAEVVIEVEPRLVDILARTYPEVRVEAQNSEKIANVNHVNYDWPVEELDFSCSMLGLYGYFKTDIEKFTDMSRHFVTNETLGNKWAEKTTSHAPGLKVGLCWRSGKKALARENQYAAIEHWRPILRQKNVTFFSLMYDECSDELKQAKDSFGVDIITFDDLDYKNEIDEVFSLTRQMDLVISANSAPASFAGVLGIPTYMPARDIGWDMLGTDHMAMVPAMKPIIQKEKGNWQPVMEELAAILRSHMA